jgi:hypothetical protein
MAGSDFGRISTWQATQWITALSEQNLWFTLFASDPHIGDPLASEIIGGSFNRVAADFGLAMATVMEQLVPVRFTGIPPASIIVAIGVMDNAFGGNFISGYVLGSPLSLPDGGSYTFGAGDYVMGLDVTTV